MPAKSHQTAVRTDTATLAVFDPTRLQHRLKDDADWWCLPEDEVQEVNLGNVVFVSTGVDGDYLIHVYEQPPPAKILKESVTAHLMCESGSLFVGAGEWVPCEGLQPHTKYGGLLLSVKRGAWRVTAHQPLGFCVDIFLESDARVSTNRFDDTLSLPWPE